jgi:hypothetical protein
MEEKKEITWEIPVESAEQMLSEHASQNEWFAGIRKQLAERKDIMREMIGRMNDEEVMELAELCFDEMEHRDYSMLIVCINQDKQGSPFIIDVAGSVLQIASSLMSMCIKREAFAKGLLTVAREYEARREELAELVGDE